MTDSPRPLPSFTSWPTFPFEGDIRVKALDEPVAVEPARHGEDPQECRACKASDEAYIWVSERWRVRSLDRPTGLPMVLVLESRSHLDLGDLPNLLAAELGVMTVRLERAVRSLDGVARVHVNRWGDGSAHLHLWFLARPHGRLQLRGSFLSLWDEILPPIPEAQWRENLALVAAWLAEFGGRPLAEPPRIDWKAPASLTPAGEREAAGGRGTGQPSAPERGTTGTRAFETIVADAGPLEPPASGTIGVPAAASAGRAREGVRSATGGTRPASSASAGGAEDLAASTGTGGRGALRPQAQPDEAGNQRAGSRKPDAGVSMDDAGERDNAPATVDAG